MSEWYPCSGIALGDEPRTFPAEDVLAVSPYIAAHDYALDAARHGFAGAIAVTVADVPARADGGSTLYVFECSMVARARHVDMTREPLRPPADALSREVRRSMAALFNTGEHFAESCTTCYLAELGEPEEASP